MHDPNEEPKYCINSTQHCIYTRRCFVTGELCSKQTNIYKERELLHAKKEINAFVIMNFSEMSDVVYKWKLRSFIESLKNHLYLDNRNHQIVCVEKTTDTPPSEGNSEWEKVEKINVIRADTNTASNYWLSWMVDVFGSQPRSGGICATMNTAFIISIAISIIFVAVIDTAS